MGHSQFAQLIKAKGPNTQSNAACASTTQALGIAQDWIRMGRCKRVIIISADNVTSDNLFEWLGSGFLASGAASIKKKVEEAALPFDRRRDGLIVGMGAAALIVETESEARRRGVEPIVEVLGTHYSNSSFHGTRLDVNHVSSELQLFMKNIHKAHGITPPELASSMMFMSHETYTPRRGGSASAEIRSLRDTFGPTAERIHIANTKGYTGHAMGAGIEDVVAIKSIEIGKIPPIANFKEPDPDLGNLKLSQGGSVNVTYALRLAAGFGSQVAFALFKKRGSGERFGFLYHEWLVSIGGNVSDLYHEGKTLRLKDQGLVQGSISTKPKTRPSSQPVVQSIKPIQARQKRIIPSDLRSKADIIAKITDVISDKTGYPLNLLDPDLDMEADLGIDTVKQAEIFGVLRDEYQLDREEGLLISDYPTISSVAGYFSERIDITDQPVTSSSVSKPKTSHKEVKPSDLEKSEVLNKILTIVAEKTGYPVDMLDPGLDMEADLGIDTVKQAELFGIIRDEYQIERMDNLLISDYPTLSHVADFVITSSDDPVSIESKPEEPQTKPVKTPPSLQTSDIDDDTRISALSIISEETGYPQSMLNEFVSLQNDLGLDQTSLASIWDRIVQEMDTKSPSLPSIDTIGELLDFIAVGKEAQPIKVKQKVSKQKQTLKEDSPIPAKPKGDRTDVLQRMISIISQKTGYPIEMLDPDLDMEADLGIDTVKQAELFGMARSEFGIPRIEGMMISEYNTINKITDLIVDSADEDHPMDVDIQTSETIAKKEDKLTYRYVLRTQQHEMKSEFQGKGIIVSTPSKAVETLAEQTGLTVNPSTQKLEFEDESMLLLINPSNSQVGSIVSLFEFLKKNITSINQIILAVKAPMNASGIIHDLSPYHASISGMIKSLAMEFGHLSSKILLFEKYEQLAAELANPGQEIIYHRGQRNEMTLLDTDLPSSNWKLPENSVLVATGGAQGITYEIVSSVASKNTTIILLGRTQLRDDAEEISSLTEKEQEERKWLLMDELKASGGKVTPVTLEKEWSKVIKSANIWKSTLELEKTGCKVIYLSIDVANSVQMKKLFGKITKEIETPITHVIHGAGIEISRATKSKKSDEFKQVYHVKALGFENLISNIDLERVERIIAFGSVAGRFGNATQVDYSAANDYLAKRCAELSREGVRATCIDWSVWSDVGMGIRGSTLQVLESQGITAIPLNEGVRRFIEEVEHGDEIEVVISGNLGALASKVVWHETKSHESIMVDQFDDTTNTAYRTLTLAKDLYLDDHRISEKAVFPGVMGLETMAEVATIITNLPVNGMNNVQFISPVKLPRDKDLEIITETESEEENLKIRLKSKFIGPQGKQLGALRNHFFANVMNGALLPPFPVMSISELKKIKNQVIMESSDIYDIFFHGPSYQVLAGLNKFTDTSVVTTFSRPSKGMFASSIPLELDPLIIEAGFQSAGLHLLLDKNVIGLPSSVAGITWFDNDNSPTFIRAQYLVSTELHAFYDIEILDETGNCIVRLEQSGLIMTDQVDTPKVKRTRDTKLLKVKSLAGRLDPDFVSIEVNCIKDVTETFVSRFLSKNEQSRYNEIKIKKKKQEWLAGRIAAKIALSKITQSMIQLIEIQTDENRSPYSFIRGEHVHVSISHSNGIAVAIAGDKAVDVEVVTKRDPSFIDEAFSSQEIKSLKLRKADAEALTRYWTLKEAHLKRMRIGLKEDLHKVEIQANEDGTFMVTSPQGTSNCKVVSDKSWVVSTAT
jgi:phosphopantetheinyl transferase/NAD(P)-dependent dehydrogenase (short-subunit alcohol dehydrogenase family)/acyl carrier protein